MLSIRSGYINLYYRGGSIWWTPKTGQRMKIALEWESEVLHHGTTTNNMEQGDQVQGCDGGLQG